MNIVKDSNALPVEFPLKVFHSRVEAAIKESKGYYHWHDFLEISYIKSGEGRYFVNGRVYDMTAGEIILFNNAELHSWEPREGKTMDVTVIIFLPSLLWNGERQLLDYEYLRPFLEMNTNFKNKLSKDNPYTGKIYNLLLQIEEEYKQKAEGYQLMIKAKLLEVMTYLIRHFQDHSKTPEIIKEKGKNLLILQKVLSYINDNFTSGVTLQQVSSIACMNANYFSTFFSTAMGISFTKYISILRVNRAEHLIQNTDLSFSVIAFECGFNSLSNFNRVFKLEKGVTPSDIRK